MLAFIKNIFSEFKKKDKDKISEDNALTILVNSKEPYIHIIIKNTNDDQVKHFAKALYELNSGLYVSFMVNILTKLSYRDKDISDFVSKVMSEWSFLIEYNQNKNNKEPLIKPTKFIGGIKNE
jgi:hypothetical protein